MPAKKGGVIMPRYPAPCKKSPEELADMATVLIDSYLESVDILDPRTKSKPKSNYASSIGHPCSFYLWARRHHWELMPTPDLVLRNIFALGREHEQSMKIRLQLDGWQVTKVETAFTDDEHDVHGYMDWELSHPTKPGWQHPVTVEFKSSASQIFNTLTTFDALFESDKKWIVTAPYQVLKYAAMDPEHRPQVAVVYRCKSTGKIKVLLANTEDHLWRLDEVHARLDEVNRCLESGEPPTPIPYERMWCEGCDAASVCPTMLEWEGDKVAELIPEPAIIDTIAEVHASCKAKSKMADDAWDDLKDQVAHYGGWKDLEPGIKRQLIGGRNRFECTVTKSGQHRLKVVPMTSEDEEVE
jgi:hypothetical protein